MRARRGGFAVGLIVGLLIGLVLALGVALYVSKVPVPFVNKLPQRTPEQDAQEAEHNKGWNPNAGLVGKPSNAGSAPAPAQNTARPPAAASPAPRAATATPPATATAAPAKSGALTYFAQAGAFTRSDDAEAQRARLALLGLDAKVSERDQSGRTVYRVRLGPFDSKTDADAVMQRLRDAGVEPALVRVQRQ